MFKSLLRTLPSLSGNFTIACKLNEIEREDNEFYHTYIRVADLIPLQNNIYKDSIELNLLNGKYEHDVKKYFSKYPNYFYKENYVFNKRNYKTLDLNSLYNENNDNRNKDYEFGCKRIYFSRHGYQFSFYAPFYLDDINDLPEYFCLHINIDNRLSKKIKIYLNKDNKINYLKRYLTAYFDKVDQKVIFCLPESSQATYFGLDVKHGGLTEYVDNMFGYLYTSQTMINSFDNIICKGFERNNLIMRQIIPLSFMFNINDIFNEHERKYFSGHKMQILGYYYSKNNTKLDMFDFDIDYFASYDKYTKYNEYSGKYEKSNGKDSLGLINVMNVGYPALNESKYVKYEFENKITPNYCKFKLMLSSDENPYITNVNFGYSYLQYPNQKYGYFPSSLKGITPGLVCIDNDVKLPIGKNIDTYYNISKYFANSIIMNNVNYEKFIKLMQNYDSAWFTMYNSDSLDSLCNDNSLWSDVVLNYSYFNGVLYNLFNLNSYNIDKFGVFLNYDLKLTSHDELHQAKYVYSYSDESQINTYTFNDNYNLKLYDPFLNISYYNNFFTNNVINAKPSRKSYLHYDKVLKQDLYGKYIKDDNYKSENVYLKLSNVKTAISKSKFPLELKNKILDLLNIKQTLGYIVLDGNNNINYFEEYYDQNNNKKKRFMLSESLFNPNTKNSKYEWLYDRLYYSTNISSQKYKLANDYNNLYYDEDINEKFIVYLEESFIYLNDLYNILIDLYNNEDTIDLIKEYLSNNMLSDDDQSAESYKNDMFIYCIILINQINNKYAFEPYGKVNDIIIENYFIEYEKIISTKSIYVDSYNLNNLINTYNSKNFTSLLLNNDNKKEYFIKVLNKDHIKEYYFKLNKDENTKSTLEFDKDNNYVNKNVLECFYVKKRSWVITNDSISTLDQYTTLYNYILKYVISYYEKDGEIDEITKSNIELVKTLINSSNDTLYDWLYSNISNTRNSNNKFELTIGTLKFEIDLCVKKMVYKLDKDLFNLMYDNNQIANYLYLYIEDNAKNENKDVWDIIGSSSINNSTEENRKVYIKNINECLSPLFTDIYVTDANKESIYFMIQHNKISNYEYIINTESYFKEINTLQALYDIYKNKEDLIDQLYYSFNSLIDHNEDSLYVKIEYLLENHLVLLQNILFVNFKDFTNNIYNSNDTINNIKFYDDNNILEDDKNNIINAIIYVIKNTLKQSELEKYLRTNNLLNKFNNEYSTQYLNDHDLLDFSNINDKITAELSFLKDESDELYYNLIRSNNIILYSIEDNFNVSLDSIDINNYQNLTYDEKNKIYIYKYNELTYGFYFINVVIDNSNFTFNILNSYNLNITFDSINGYDINDKRIMTKYIPLLYPFMKFNIFDEFAKLVSTIIYQNELEILIKYTKGDYLTAEDQLLKYKKYITSPNDILYKSLIEFDKYKRIKILRYFNYITPYLKKINNVIDNVWTLRLMEYDDKYNDIEKYNILDVDNINIYKYEPLNIYCGEYKQYDNDVNYCYEFTDSYKIDQIEHKHFNDNIIYNLPEQIEIYDEQIFTKKEILNVENDMKYFENKKINILYKYFYGNGLDYTNIKLFLFNKYNSSFFIEKNKNKYKIKYTFNLV